jgi:hypothetical protein
MYLKWRSSIRWFSQIWLQTRYENRKKPESFYILGYLPELIIKIWRFTKTFVEIWRIWATISLGNPLYRWKSYFWGRNLAKFRHIKPKYTPQMYHLERRFNAGVNLTLTRQKVPLTPTAWESAFVSAYWKLPLLLWVNISFTGMFLPNFDLKVCFQPVQRNLMENNDKNSPDLEEEKTFKSLEFYVKF